MQHIQQPRIKNPKTFFSGRITLQAGGNWETVDVPYGFTLAPGESERKAICWFPASEDGKECYGTYQEIWEGTDADGNPVSLKLEFNGSKAEYHGR